MPALPEHFFVYHLRSTPETHSGELAGRSAILLRVPPAELQQPFPVEFERLRERWENTPGGYCEGDGAVGWHPPDFPGTGMVATLHCVGEHVLCWEVHGRFTRAGWDRLCELAEWGDLELALQFPEWGVLISANQFHEWLDA